MQQPTVNLPGAPTEALPDHTQLPDKDGSIVTNFQENPQSYLLTSCLEPRLNQIHPDGQFAIGMDSGIYWRLTTPPLESCKSPDWFYVPNVPPMLDGQIRRSYVLWKEGVRPLLIVEYVSGDGSEEHDATPRTGKFWVYEHGIGVPYYAIFDGWRGTLELFTIQQGRYQTVAASSAGRYPIAPLRVELGLWQGHFRGMDATWLRVWDSATGIMLPSYEERVEAEHQRAEAEHQRADTAESLADDLNRELTAECERAEMERKRAETERKRAETADAQALALQQQLEQLNARLRDLGIDPQVT